MKETVRTYIEEHEPVEHEDLKELFGVEGLVAARELMKEDEVTFDINWRIAMDD